MTTAVSTDATKQQMINALEALMADYEGACRHAGYDPDGSKGYEMAKSLIAKPKGAES